MSVSITLNVNGVPYPLSVEPHRTLVSVIRGEVGLTGTKEGCDDCECGACMVLVDGRPVNSCSYLAVQTDGREVTTVEGLGTRRRAAPAAAQHRRRGRRAVRVLHARACSSRRPRCWPQSPQPSEDEIRIALGGNLCRCTGYQKIVRAVQRTADELACRAADPRSGVAHAGGLTRRVRSSAADDQLGVAHERDAVAAADLHRDREPLAVARRPGSPTCRWRRGRRCRPLPCMRLPGEPRATARPRGSRRRDGHRAE